MTSDTAFPAHGGCDGRAMRYRLPTASPVVHCGHRRRCRRVTGAAFALNALIESDGVNHLGIEPEIVDTPSDSGLGQRVARVLDAYDERKQVWSPASLERRRALLPRIAAHRAELARRAGGDA